MSDLDSVLVRDRQRYLVLNAVYHVSGGSRLELVPYETVMAHSQLAWDEVEQAVLYLAAEGLVDPSSHSVCITHRGVKEIEASIKNPSRETEHFSVKVIQFNAPVGAVQTGQGNVANVTQNISVNTAEALKLIEGLRGQLQSLPDAQRQEATEFLEDLASETQSAHPRLSRIKSALLSLFHAGKELAPWVTIIGSLTKLFGFQLPP